MLDASYRIEQVIGAGGFGVTYRADDVNLGTTVAIKEYYPEEFGARDTTLSVLPRSSRHTATFEWGRASFLREARTLARFRHHSIVQVTRVFEANSTAYMVMIFEEGRPFEEWLKGIGRLPTQDELDRIAGPLLDALEIMHKDSFMHRDIAPDNIVIRADGSPVLLDFGAARQAIAAKSQAVTGIVKPGYSPHEQYSADGRRQGPWTDLYAFGATFYRAISGSAPEEATLRMDDDRLASAVSIGEGRYRPDFLKGIDLCLMLKWSDRPESVRQLRSILIEPRVVATARSLGLTQEMGTQRRQHNRRYILPWVVAGVAFLIAGGWYGWYQYPPLDFTDNIAMAKKTEIEEARRAAAAKAAEEEARREADKRELMAAWDAVKDSTNVAQLEAFVQRYSSSFYADLARVRIAELEKQAADAAAKAKPVSPVESLKAPSSKSKCFSFQNRQFCE